MLQIVKDQQGARRWHIAQRPADKTGDRRLAARPRIEGNDVVRRRRQRLAQGIVAGIGVIQFEVLQKGRERDRGMVGRAGIMAQGDILWQVRHKRLDQPCLAHAGSGGDLHAARLVGPPDPGCAQAGQGAVASVHGPGGLAQGGDQLGCHPGQWHLEHRYPALDAPDFALAQSPQRKAVPHEPFGAVGQHHRAGARQILDAGGDVERVAHGAAGLVKPANHHHAGR